MESTQRPDGSQLLRPPAKENIENMARFLVATTFEIFSRKHWKFEVETTE